MSFSGASTRPSACTTAVAERALGRPPEFRIKHCLFAEPQIAEEISGDLTEFVARWPQRNHQLQVEHGLLRPSQSVQHESTYKVASTQRAGRPSGRKMGRNDRASAAPHATG